MTFTRAAGKVFAAYERRWKPRTERVNRSYLVNTILPFFGAMKVREIQPHHVVRWMRTLHSTPAAANRSLPVLSTILRECEAYGWRPQDSNPARGVRRYKEVRRERFLTDGEFSRLGVALAAHPDQSIADLIRVLVLTGARNSEIRRLRVAEVGQRNIHLTDSKTGPKTIYLGPVVRDILRRHCGRRRDGFVFAGVGLADGYFASAYHREKRGGKPPGYRNLFDHWAKIREAAGLGGDLRIHDLRHSYASVAVRLDVPITTTGKLLGHSTTKITMRYTHLTNPHVLAATENVGARIAKNLLAA